MALYVTCFIPTHRAGSVKQILCFLVNRFTVSEGSYWAPMKPAATG